MSNDAASCGVDAAARALKLLGHLLDRATDNDGFPKALPHGIIDAFAHLSRGDQKDFSAIFLNDLRGIGVRRGLCVHER